MTEGSILNDADQFARVLYDRMLPLNPGLADLALYEFRYALDRLAPPEGWAAVAPLDPQELAGRVHQQAFFTQVQLKPMQSGRITLDATVLRLTQTLLVGLASGAYSLAWVHDHFYFDIRAFLFFVRTPYFTPAVREHFGGKPYRQLASGQARLECLQDIGYREFRQANAEIDQAFIAAIQALIRARGTPFLLSLVGPSAAGKTEIVAQLREALARDGKRLTSLEMDHFLKDREFRDGCPMGPEIMHFELFKAGMAGLLAGRPVVIPRYDFLRGCSSHDLDGRLRSGQTPLAVEPADIVFLEGNFPFHHPEIAPLVGIKVVYLTDDPVRLKRKWKRDIDYRKKYDPFYLCNRYFRTQALRAGEIYRPALQLCDLAVDTTAAALWATPAMAEILDRPVSA